MSSQMIIRIDTNTKEKIMRIARNEGKSVSQVVRDLLDNYIRERDMGGYIDDLWKRSGLRMKSNGVKATDVERIIKEVRQEKK